MPSPPDGGVAAAMLCPLFIAARAWTVATWALGLPNSSSHALIGALIGVAVESAQAHGRGLGQGVDRTQVWSALLSPLVSPVLGFAPSFGLFHLTRPLVLTCTGASFSHGTNDGQKSIGLIMLTVVGLMPAAFALNRDMSADRLHHVAQIMPAAAQLIDRDGDDRKRLGVVAARKLGDTFGAIKGVDDIPAAGRSAARSDLNRVVAELHGIGDATVSADDKAQAKAFDKDLTRTVCSTCPGGSASWARSASAPAP